MEEEEKAQNAPEESPTAVAAGKLGISVPPKSDGPIDGNTGLPKSWTPEKAPNVLDASEQKLQKST